MTLVLSCIGQFGVGKMNENGQRLLELCTYHDLCIANSYFRTKPQDKVSWRHPCSKHWHQLDMIILRRASLKNVLHSADCNTDHSLVCCRIRLQPKRFHRTKKQGNPRIDVSHIIIIIIIILYYRLAEHINRYMTVVQYIVSSTTTD